ncbi:MAG: hypothetical protein ACK44Y_06605 [Novosphingobium sp.]
MARLAHPRHYDPALGPDDGFAGFDKAGVKGARQFAQRLRFKLDHLNPARKHAAGGFGGMQDWVGGHDWLILGV